MLDNYAENTATESSKALKLKQEFEEKLNSGDLGGLANIVKSLKELGYTFEIEFDSST